MDCLTFFYTFNIVLGGKGAEVVVFKKTNENRKAQRKVLDVPSNFGSDCKLLSNAGNTRSLR